MAKKSAGRGATPKKAGAAKKKAPPKKPPATQKPAISDDLISQVAGEV